VRALSGKVYIVGVGPSIELVTKKAEKMIREADVILHDELIDEGLKKLIRESKAEVIDVGKRTGKHKFKQEEINRLLAKHAKEGKNVVRIKGGDPFIFGRGGEEAEFLAENGIKFEIIPGITSAIAAPAYAGIPLAHRSFDPAIVFLTGREAKGRERTNWEALANLNATIVILMGVSTLRRNMERLIKYGKDPDTPVAIIENGCTERQRVVMGKLKDIADIAEKEKVKAPAIIVIGNVVKLREKLLPFLEFEI
jgi:uroporphyrin-III C-methyltransferase